MAAALATALLLAACIGDDDGGPGPSDGGDAAPPADTIRLGVGGDLRVDPAQASLASASDLMVLDLLHDGLTRLDEKGAVQPALAKSWAANDDSTAFRFALRADATFASGAPITPQDVIASLERVMAAGDSSLPALSLEAVEGFSKFASGKAEHVSGLTAPTAHTVRIALATPLSELPVVLSSPIMSVIDADTIDGDLEKVDLSGAWSVASNEDDVLTLESRDQAASLRRVQVYAYDDPEDAYSGFRDGKVDWAEIPSDEHDDAVDEYGDGAFAAYEAELFFGMNVKAQALKSGTFREAIVQAVDRQEIVDEVYADLADPLSTVVPAGVKGHDDGRCPDCEYDPARAKRLVKKAYPKGDVPTVKIDYDESPVQEAMAKLVAGDLEDVGIPTKLRPQPLDDYKAFVVSGDQVMFSFGWIGAYRSPDAYLAPLFGSSANDNLTNFRSNHVDALLSDAREDSDPAKNATRWARAEEEILAADVVVPIVQFRTQAVVSERVQGLQHAVDGTVDWTKVTLDG